MISFDTNIVVHSANSDAQEHEKARAFILELAQREDVIVCDLMLVEVFLKLCNAKIFRRPLSSKEAGVYCERLRKNQKWRLVESASVMDEVWRGTQKKNFAFRRIIDFRLGLTLRHHGVTDLATTNVKDFKGLGFERVWNPLR
ncbi:MAG: TA system VapC family ribonuclease toxin [Verrucomicrobiota bacterium]